MSVAGGGCGVFPLGVFPIIHPSCIKGVQGSTPAGAWGVPHPLPSGGAGALPCRGNGGLPQYSLSFLLPLSPTGERGLGGVGSFPTRGLGVSPIYLFLRMYTITPPSILTQLFSLVHSFRN